MLATVKSGHSVKDDVLPGPIKLKAATVWARAMDDKFESDRAIALVSACELGASEEKSVLRPRPHRACPTRPSPMRLDRSSGSSMAPFVALFA